MSGSNYEHRVVEQIQNNPPPPAVIQSTYGVDSSTAQKIYGDAGGK